MFIFLICRSPSHANPKKIAVDVPEIDEISEINETLVTLDTYNSDINMIIDAKNFVSGAPLTEAGFAYMFAGSRATDGFAFGKVYYEVKVKIIYFEIFLYH
jgi:heterogeneous nuclear ribonucleoprotein U-like protein 1